MDLLRKGAFAFILLLLTVFTNTGFAKVQTSKYGIAAFSDSASTAIASGYKTELDSVFKNHPRFKDRVAVSAIAHTRVYQDKTADFYLLMVLTVVLGLIRLMDPKYFQSLWQAFRNPSAASRQLKDKIQSASFPNLFMNLYFMFAAAAYVYYVVRNFMPQRSGSIPPSLLLLMLIGGMMVIYLGKYSVIRFSGWAFRVEGITEHYLFNVFLVNKVLSIALLPFIIFLAFAEPAVAQPCLIISFIIILVLFVNRYLRSWQVFGSFFQYSKFHFFTYLCASELLPLAVLMKLLVRGLLY